MKVTITYSDVEGSGCGTVEFSWRDCGNPCKCQDSRSRNDGLSGTLSKYRKVRLEAACMFHNRNVSCPKHWWFGFAAAFYSLCVAVVN